MHMAGKQAPAWVKPANKDNPPDPTTIWYFRSLRASLEEGAPLPNQKECARE